MDNTEKKPDGQIIASAAELSQTELNKVAGGGTVTSKPSMSEIQVTKSIDKSSTNLNQS